MAKTNAQVALEAASRVAASYDSDGIYTKGNDAVLGTAQAFYRWLESKE